MEESRTSLLPVQVKASCLCLPACLPACLHSGPSPRNQTPGVPEESVLFQSEAQRQRTLLQCVASPERTTPEQLARFHLV